MSKPRVFYNRECDECANIEEEMVKVGGIILCKYCFREQFSTDDPVKKEREKYLKLLNASIEKALEEIKNG